MPCRGDRFSFLKRAGKSDILGGEALRRGSALTLAAPGRTMRQTPYLVEVAYSGHISRREVIGETD